MDKEKRKVLREQYDQMKPDMGIFMFRCNPAKRVYLGFDQNLKGTLNGISFQLRNNSYLTNRTLQKDWKEHGQDNFTIEVLEILPYDKDLEAKEGESTPVPRSDYKDDLLILLEGWREKLTKEGFEVRNVRGIKK